MKQSNIHLLMCILAAATVSCNKNEAETETGDELVFNVIAQSMNYNSDVQTRGQRYNSEREFRTETFGLYGWNTSTGQDFCTNESVSYTENKWKPAGDFKLSKKSNYVFEAVYPKFAEIPGDVGLTDLTMDPDPDNIQFGYTVPSTTMEAANKDFMLAYYSGTCTQGAVPLTFTHPLTCVNFKAGTLSGVSKINSIKISGVYDSGGCIFVRTTTDASGNQCFSYEADDPDNTSLWIPSGVTMTVTGTSEIKASTLSTSMDEYNFLLIPQNTADVNASIIINFTDNLGEVFEVNTIISSTYWRAGHTYTYKVSIDASRNLTLEISDEIEDNVKNNVVITNTGEATAYVRATIVGNWVDASGNILAPWDFYSTAVEYVIDDGDDGNLYCIWVSSQGTFTGLPGNNWISRSENGTTVYYYKYPITTGQSIPDALFTSFTASESTVSGGHLEMEILVQGVSYDKEKYCVTEAWGSEIASQLQTLE